MSFKTKYIDSFTKKENNNKKQNKTKTDQKWPALTRKLVPPEHCTIFSLHLLALSLKS